MSTVDPLAALSGNSAADATKKAPTQLGQNEFLKLMLAQLKNQDPFKPQDPAAFLSQLAQFSTVTGIQNMQGSVSGLADSLRSTQVLNGATLVGREILAPATAGALTAGSSLHGAAEIPDGATSVEVGVRDSSGQLVRRFSIAPQSGLAEFNWDGLMDNGASAPTGTYQFQVVANVGGEGVSVDPLLASRVASVTIDKSGLVLNTGIGAIAIGDVRRVM
jgi:flagellar basal-body rod modification protein FlgD